MKKIFCLFLVISILPIYGQNLILNSSFEEYEYPAQDIFYAKDWFVPNNCTVDYYTEEYPKNPTFVSFTHMSSSTRNKKIGYNKPYSGNAYIGLVLLGWQGGMEHYTGILKRSLLKDSLYKITFYIKYGGDVFWLYSKNIEILFSMNKPSFGSRDYKDLFSKENSYVANIKIDIQHANNERNWVKCVVNYKALGGEQFMTLGLFHQEKNKKFIQLFDKYKENIESDYLKQKKFVAKHEVFPLVPNKTSKQSKKDRLDNVIAYYLIDDVKVVPVDDQGNEIVLYPELFEKITIPDTANEKIIEIKNLEVGTPLILRNIYFELDKWKLLATSKPELNKLIEALHENQSLKIEISGHTDNTGTEEHNQQLSEQRALAVVNYMVSHGIVQERLFYKGYGSSKPIESNETEKGRSQNRRVELIVLEK